MSAKPQAAPPALKDLSTHFAFGQNWASYSAIIDDARIAQAERGLVRLLGEDGLAGKSFLDVGSVFELAPETSGAFDVVYSWGVLHHTGAMHEALQRAAEAVAPGGQFAFALYHRTRMCGFWRREKRWYAAASPRAQRAARAIYTALLRLRVGLTGGDFRAYVANYHSQRGMEFGHDVHDWMGGYPYESISAPEVAAFMQRLGFAHVRSFTSPLTIGLFGSGCDEYVYRRMG